MTRSSSPDVSLTQDESFTATSHRGLTYPLGKFAPGAGELHDLLGGVGWARIPMPGSLGHINIWAIGDGAGVTVVDTGLKLPLSEQAWDGLFAGPLAARPVTRVICTHLHPDHIGMAGWLCARFDAMLWMTRGEWLTARMLITDARDDIPADVIRFRRAAGWSDDQIAEAGKQGWGRFRHIVHPLPQGYRRIVDGEMIRIGDHDWQVVVGSGHSPEHACLWNQSAGVLIAGDQVLPRISSNVSLGVTEPEGDPLGDWLRSIARLKQLPADTLVLPAHGEPFTGLHARLDALDSEHRMRLDMLAEFIGEAPRRSIDCFGRLFRREIGSEQLGLATGEALAHLRHLEVTGRAVRSIVDGVWWYRAS